MHHSNKNDADTESISDDSVLKNSLTIQSINSSSRDVSPFKGSRNSWNTNYSDNITSPLPSPRPVTGQTQPQTDQTQCAIDIDNNSNQTKNKISTEL